MGPLIVLSYQHVQSTREVTAHTSLQHDTYLISINKNDFFDVQRK